MIVHIRNQKNLDWVIRNFKFLTDDIIQDYKKRQRYQKPSAKRHEKEQLLDWKRRHHVKVYEE